MIRDTVNPILARKSEPYASRGFCARCNALDYTARLLVPFSQPIHVCRSCREKITGIVDLRNMRTPLIGDARMAVEFAQLAPPPIVVRGLLMPGPHVHACVLDDDDANHSTCRCSCGATATNTMGEIEWWTPRREASYTPELTQEQVDAIFAPGDDDELDLEGVRVEMEKLDAIDRELDVMIAELDRRGR